LYKKIGPHFDYKTKKEFPSKLMDWIGDVFYDATASDEINQWLARTTKGERSEMPHISDSVWRQIVWDETMPCDACHRRGLFIFNWL
jgi:hypothetical protein